MTTVLKTGLSHALWLLLLVAISACSVSVSGIPSSNREIDESSEASSDFIDAVSSESARFGLELSNPGSVYDSGITLCEGAIRFGMSPQEVWEETLSDPHFDESVDEITGPGQSDLPRDPYVSFMTDVLVPSADRYLCPDTG